MTEPIDSFLSAWTAAERAGDTQKLEALLTDDFYGVGPLGFILPRPAWLARHRQGGLAYQTFDLDEIQTQLHGEVTLVTARNNTRGTYQGHPIPEAVRATLVITTDRGSRRLAAIHMSFIAGTPGAPPIPGATSPPAQSSQQ
jgi:ketosteroid isomerase-like protein